MTAIRNFPDSPLARRSASPMLWRMPAFAVALWQGLTRYGHRRAARELALMADRRAHGDPVLARQLREAAHACRRAAIAPRT